MHQDVSAIAGLPITASTQRQLTLERVEIKNKNNRKFDNLLQSIVEGKQKNKQWTVKLKEQRILIILGSLQRKNWRPTMFNPIVPH